MDDLIEFVIAKEPGHAIAVGDIGPQELKRRTSSQARQPGFFETNIIIVVEIVDANDFVTTSQQASACVHADEAGRAGYQDLHVRSFV